MFRVQSVDAILTKSLLKMLYVSWTMACCFSFHPLAFFWNSAPGKEAGIYFSQGIVSTKNAPGMLAACIPRRACSARSMCGSFSERISIPYAIASVTAPA